MDRFVEYIRENWVDLLSLTYDHIVMVVMGVVLALIVGIPLGVVCSLNRRWAALILGIANVVQVIPSLALLVMLMIVFGLGSQTVIVGLFLYSLLPIIRNTYVGLTEINSSITEAGKGVGMSPLQVLMKVQLPLSLPFIMTGVRVAAVIAIGVAAVAPFIGGDGLGREIYAGINYRNDLRIYGGAIPAALLAILADIFLGKLQKRVKLDK
ncbi:ABC transporter permease [Paenibacillus sp. J2TS4]|uniref:ABC transporter permease n=1 Tax=Paenibacillus sp. J2TS4 TaxID=2807194 RepID=UPI001B07826E|nr:ABC transporter permease [Paenibacillus sp. J2TS4]GIP35699.1 amino acid ABC transporter permease [Paenibacillus sp. J2TS4]